MNQSEELFYDFLTKSDEQKQEFITFRNRYDYYFKMNDVDAAPLLNNKYKTYSLFKDLFKRDVVLLKDENDYEKFSSFVKKHPEFVVKPSSLGLTIGVYKESIDGKGDLKALFKKILDKASKAKRDNAWGDSWVNDQDCSVVLEEVIEQDGSLADIHPGSINGVRVSTVFGVDEKPAIFYPWFKIGAYGKFITAEAFGSLMAGIDPKTGVVDTPGIDESGVIYEVHPDTQVKIEGYKIPRWQELVDICSGLSIEMHKSGIDYVGWDMALTRDGWSIIEGNFDGEFLGQLVYHRGIRRELESLIGWKPKKEFWWERQPQS